MKKFVTLGLLCLTSAVFAEDVVRVDAGKLYAEYEKNAIAADKKYKDKELLISGTIDKIDKDLLGKPFARLHVNDFLGVQCNFAPESIDQLAKARVKAHVLIKGKVQGRIGNVIVTECSFGK